MRSLLHSPSALLFFCPSVCLSLQRWNACFLSQLWWTLLWINIQCELSHAQNCSKCNLSLSNSLWSEDSPPWYIAADPFSEPLLQLITCAIPGSLQDIFPFVEHWKHWGDTHTINAEKNHETRQSLAMLAIQPAYMCTALAKICTVPHRVVILCQKQTK